MSFEDAVHATTEIRGAYRPGLQALQAAARKAIQANDTRRLEGSVDIDTTLRPIYPQDPRWDYVVSVQDDAGAPRLYWIEYHEANGETAKDVASKARWVKQWARTAGRPVWEFGGRKMDLRWIASGRVRLPKKSRQVRLLAQEGVHPPVRRLKVE
jgi:hypothetical protein